MNHTTNLITRYLDGVATNQEVAELEQQLTGNSDLQDLYLEAIELDCLLKQEAQDASLNVSLPKDTAGIEIVRPRQITKCSVAIAASVIFLLFWVNQEWNSKQNLIATTPSLGEVQFTNSESNSKLCQASSDGNLESVKSELAIGANINFINKYGLSPLHLASIYGHRDVVTYLIEKGADLHQPDGLGNTPLHISAFLGRWVIVEELLEAGSNPKIRNQDGFNTDDLVALNWNPNLERYYSYLANAFKVDLDFAQIKKARPQIRTTIGRYMAKQERNREIDTTSWLVLSSARLLGQSLAELDQGFSPTKLSKSGLAPATIAGSFLSETFSRVIPRNSKPEPPSVSLIQAAKSGNIAAVRQHITAGSNLNEKNDFDGCTPVILAAVFGWEEIVREFIKADADLTATNNQKNTALHAAAFFCRREIVQMLLDADVDLIAVNDQEETAYDIAAKPLTNELRSVYRYIYGLLRLELDMEQIEQDREFIAALIAAKSNHLPTKNP